MKMVLRVFNTGNTPDNADIDLNSSGYVQKWVRLEGSVLRIGGSGREQDRPDRYRDPDLECDGR